MHSIDLRQGPSRGAVTAALAILLTTSMALASWGPAVAQDETVGAASVVVTTEVLGTIVSELVGDAAEVNVLMSGGANPHTFEPSARDAEGILNADLVISNGLDLEEGLLPVLEMTESEGVAWFEAADHLDLRSSEASGVESGHDEDDEHAADAQDPHIWTDPLIMRDVVVALEPVLAGVGIDVGEGEAELVARLEALDAEVAGILSGVPEEQRKLVTGHRSLGYFADRYGFELIGTVIPGLSTSGEPTARELAALIDHIRESGVRAVFAEVGTPQSVARAVADDSGVTLVELSTVTLPDAGTYESLILDMATAIAAALGE